MYARMYYRCVKGEIRLDGTYSTKVLVPSAM
jgi:hypothetical protein